jgi:tRNA-Thr(GGU) m(6)t(6)A37 methyltransferase TsaA
MLNSNLSSQCNVITLSPIGLIHTPFQHSNGTPIQGAVSKDAQGVVELLPEFVPGLLDLEAFERLWLIYLLDRASAFQMIVRPYLENEEHGVFATRAPARRNPIGLTAVRLLGIEGNRLLIAGVDMLDGTPLIDIKPYVPAFDSFSVNRVGWYPSEIAQGAVADDRFENPEQSNQGAQFSIASFALCSQYAGCAERRQSSSEG